MYREFEIGDTVRNEASNQINIGAYGEVIKIGNAIEVKVENRILCYNPLNFCLYWKLVQTAEEGSDEIEKREQRGGCSSCV